MRSFMVISEEYETGGYIYGLDPPEIGRDVWEGEAKNRGHAHMLAMKEWLKQNHSMALDNRSDGRHPMSGAKVIELLPCAVHGVTRCEQLECFDEK